jgi:hypothetical protein
MSSKQILDIVAVEQKKVKFRAAKRAMEILLKEKLGKL